jgi:hypothetical protein
MAYGTFQPTSFNATPLYAGLSSMGSSIGQAIEARKKADDEDKDFAARSRAAESYLESHATDFGFTADSLKEALKKNKDETPRGRYLRVSDMVTNAGHDLTLKALKLQQDKAQLDIEAMKRAAAAEATNNVALKASVNPEEYMLKKNIRGGAVFGDGGITAGKVMDETPDQSLGPNAELEAYYGSGGTDAEQARVLAGIGANRQKHPAPVLQTFGHTPSGRPIQGITTASGVQLVKQDEEPVTANVGGEEVTHFGGSLLNKKGQIMGSAPRLPAPELQFYDKEAYDLGLKVYKDYYSERQNGAAPGTAAPVPTAVKPRVTVNSKAELDALKDGTPFNWPGKGSGTKRDKTK